MRIKGLDRRAERGEAGIPLKSNIFYPRNPHNQQTLSAHKASEPKASDFLVARREFTHAKTQKKTNNNPVVTRLEKSCLSLPDHRTFIEDYLKILDFIEWLKEYYPDKVPQLSHRK